MSKSASKDTLTTLDDLKRAIHAVGVARSRHDESSSIQTNLWATSAEREAWKAAFQWRDQFGEMNRNCDCKICREECARYDEGMALIREKLQS